MAQKTINPTLFAGMAGEFSDASPRATRRVIVNSHDGDTMLYGSLCWDYGVSAMTVNEITSDNNGEKLCFLVNPKEDVLKSGIPAPNPDGVTFLPSIASGGLHSIATRGRIWVGCTVIVPKSESADGCGSKFVFFAQDSIGFTDVEIEGGMPDHNIVGVRLRRFVETTRISNGPDYDMVGGLAEVEVCDPYVVALGDGE